MQAVDQLWGAAERFAFELPLTTQLMYIVGTLVAVLAARAWVSPARPTFAFPACALCACCAPLCFLHSTCVPHRSFARSGQL
jgi:hypothetical protein